MGDANSVVFCREVNTAYRNDLTNPKWYGTPNARGEVVKAAFLNI
jgi:hypothetical protein